MRCGIHTLCRRYVSTAPKDRYDVVVVGGGHNGLTAAAYLARAGKQVCVLERRHVLGGAAVTEEIVPGFKFSRASYLLSLLRPVVIRDLNLKTFPKYEKFVEHIVKPLAPLMDEVPLDLTQLSRWELIQNSYKLFRTAKQIGFTNLVDFYELMTAPIAKIMDRWFQSDVLKATLGTDGVIGFAASPYDAGTGYVLLHHVLGGMDNRSGTWAYVFGGMGAVSRAIEQSARASGAEIFVEQEVAEILVDNGTAQGVRLADGREIHAPTLLSNATPKVTFEDLIAEENLPEHFLNAVKAIDYTSPVTKLNVAVRELPSFTCLPNVGTIPMAHHQTTMHLNCESMKLVDEGVCDFRNGMWSKNPIIEMTIPSVVDRSLVPDEQSQVISLFTQYTPYELKKGPWNEERKEEYAKHVFSEIDAYAPNFSSSVIGYEVLPPPEIERIFGLTGGNIFHGSMSLDQLYFARPVPRYSSYKTSINGLFLCGSGAHPGGGVTGAPGRLAALAALQR